MENASFVFISWCLEHLNYWTITLLMAIESSFIPFPSEIVVPPAAYHAAASGEMSLWLVIFFATLGADLGALLNYGLSRSLGRVIIYRFADSKLGHLLLVDRQKVEVAEKYFSDHGAISTFVGRLIPAVRQLISIPAGLARMNVGKFLIYTTLGAAVWNTILACAGYYLESVMSEDEMLATVTRYNTELKIFCCVVFVLVVAFFVARHFVSKKKSVQ